MTLVDFEIMHRCGDRSFEPQWWNLKALAHKWLIPCPKNPMIYPYNPEQVNAASYDVCIGDTVKWAYKPEGYGQWRRDFNSFDLRDGKKMLLHQGDFILTETDNFFNIPRNVSAQFALKSSRGREGFGHALAGFIDPAWHGSKLTLELFNHNPNPIPIYKGLRIGQIIFTKTNAQPIKAYDRRGRYNNDNGVRESKG
jgi:dCTP deaminase